MIRGRRGLTVLSVAGVVALGAACSSGSDDDDVSAPAVTAFDVDDEDALDQIVLPGERTPATSPAGATSTTFGVPTSSTTTTTSSTTSTTSTSSTTTTTTSSTTTLPAGVRPRFGPTLLIDDGGTQSTFEWELVVTVPGGGQVATSTWVVDGDSERIDLADDLADSTIVRIGNEFWRSDTSGTLLPVSADEYREERQTIEVEVLDTDPGAVIASDVLAGPGTYEVRTSDQATITAVFGGEPPPGENSVLLGDVELDAALRVVQWNLAYTSDTGGGQTVYILDGRLEPTVIGPIERP